jgi:hypothetical protein
VKKSDLQIIIEKTDFETRAYRNCRLGVVIPQGDDALSLAGAVMQQLAHHDVPTIVDVGYEFTTAREEQLGKGRIVYFPETEYVE